MLDSILHQVMDHPLYMSLQVWGDLSLFKVYISLCNRDSYNHRVGLPSVTVASSVHRVVMDDAN